MNRLAVSMKRLASLALAAVLSVGLLAGCGSSDAGTADISTERILANLRVEIPQLRTADSLRIDSLKESSIDDFYQAQLVVDNRNRVYVLVREDGSEALLLAGPPLDVSRSLADMQTEQEEQAREQAAVIEEAAAGMPSLGPPDAPVTLVEFSDFQCPYCARVQPMVKTLREQYPEQLRVVFLHFPLSSHEWARPAAIAAQCAARQSENAFWTLHDYYFTNQDALTPANVVQQSKTALSGSSIDTEQWEACASGTSVEAYREASQQVTRTLEAGKEAGVTGTPSFYINGEKVEGARSIDAFAQRIEQAAAES
jgi:protein-disulfide isomerase